MGKDREPILTHNSDFIWFLLFAPYFLLHSEKKNKQKHKVWLKVYMPQELGDLYFEEKVAGAIFDLPYQES